MNVIHVANFDCFKSSRINMQSLWESQSFYLHKSNQLSAKSNKISLNKLLNILKSSNYDLVLFHAQSSLFFLIIAIIFFPHKKRYFVYDIHDLNVINNSFNYKFIRSIIFYFIEFLILKIFKIRAITVSSGLSGIITKRYNINEISIVRNISVSLDEIEIDYTKRNKKVLYFGNFDRLNDKFFRGIIKNNLEIDLYGKFQSENMSKKLKKILDNDNVKYLGEYNPKDLSFIKNYEFIYYNIDPYDINYKFAGPNKFFQALSHGLILIIPKGYEEMEFIFKNFKNFFVNPKNDIINLKNSNKISKSDHFKILNHIKFLKNNSELNYKNLYLGEK